MLNASFVSQFVGRKLILPTRSIWAGGRWRGESAETLGGGGRKLRCVSLRLDSVLSGGSVGIKQLSVRKQNSVKVKTKNTERNHSAADFNTFTTRYFQWLSVRKNIHKHLFLSQGWKYDQRWKKHPRPKYRYYWTYSSIENVTWRFPFKLIHLKTRCFGSDAGSSPCLYHI